MSSCFGECKESEDRHPCTSDVRSPLSPRLTCTESQRRSRGPGHPRDSLLQLLLLALVHAAFSGFLLGCLKRLPASGPLHLTLLLSGYLGGSLTSCSFLLTAD